MVLLLLIATECYLSNRGTRSQKCFMFVPYCFVYKNTPSTPSMAVMSQRSASTMNNRISFDVTALFGVFLETNKHQNLMRLRHHIGIYAVTYVIHTNHTKLMLKIFPFQDNPN